jgi:phosphatidylglycerophosphatase A
MKINPILLVATGGGSGYLPRAPGTAGAVVGLGLYAVLVQLCAALPLPLDATLAALALAVSAAGVWASEHAQRLFGQADDPRITVDEVAGMLTALLFLPPRLEVALFGFLAFRVLDIVKPWPVNRAEALPGGLGVMADDLVAGVGANLGGQLLWRLLWRGALA